MKRLLLLTSLALLAVIAPAQTRTPMQALADYQKYEFERRREAETKQLAPPELELLLAEIQKKAKDSLAEFDIEKCETKDCICLAELAISAEDNAKAIRAASRYLESKPDGDATYRAYDIMLSAYSNLGDGQNIFDILTKFVPVKDNLKIAQATMTAYFYADVVNEKLNLDKALTTLDLVKGRILPIKPGAEDKKMHMNILTGIFDKKADLLGKAGRTDDALKAIDEGIKAVGDANAAILKGAKTRLTMVGKQAPAIPIERGYGTFDGLTKWKGKVVILDFFAHWCGPCIASFPEMKELYSEFHGKGLEMVGFTTYYGFYNEENSAKRDMAKDTEFAKMGDFIKEHDLPWPVVYGERTVFSSYGVTAIPHMVIIDKSGKISTINVGFDLATKASVRALIEKLLAE